ncbi:MAG: hypothetical protein Q9222_002302 [Ikaeria aurantiellina]
MEEDNHQGDPNPAIGTPTTVSPLEPYLTTLTVSQREPEVKSAKASLRSKITQHWGSVRRPKRARAKSLTHARPIKQIHSPSSRQLDPQALAQSPPIRNVRHSVSAPAIHRKPIPELRYIGLEDRLAKVPVAIPIAVRKANVQNPTDQTMATRGSGSTASRLGGNHLDIQNPETQDLDRRDKEVALKEGKGKHSLWTQIKHVVRKVFSRRKE